MGETTVPVINEIAFFLKERAAKSYAHLQSVGPDVAAALATGYVGGAEPASAPTEEGKQDVRRAIRARAQVLAEALRELISQSTTMSLALKQKLATLKKLQFFASVTSALASSGVLGFAIAEKQAETIALAVAALLSSVATIAASTLILGDGRKESDLVETLRTLSRATTFAELTSRMLATLAELEDGDEELKTLIEQANAQFRELNEALANAAA